MKIEIKGIHIELLMILFFIIGAWVGFYLNDGYPVTTTEELSWAGVKFTQYHYFFGSSLWFAYIFTLGGLLAALFLIAAWMEGNE